MKSPIIVTGALVLATAALIYHFVSVESDNMAGQANSPLAQSIQKELSGKQNMAAEQAPAGLSKRGYESHNIDGGTIGIDPQTNIDNPHDNTFHIFLDGEIESGRQAWLE